MNDKQRRAEKTYEEARAIAFEVYKKAILGLLAKHPDGATKTDLRDKTGISMPRVNAAVAELLDSGDVVQVDLSKGKRTFEGFQLAGGRNE